VFRIVIVNLFIVICIYKTSFGNANQDRVLNFLQTFETLNAKFIQINNNGEILSGKILISRPGKTRIEYNEIPLLLISDGKRFASINNKIKSITFYNLADIPVSLFLYKNFEKKNIEIIGLYEKENQIKIRIRHRKRNDESFLEIVFEKNPFIMKKWTIFQDPTNKIEVLLDTLIINEKNFVSSFNIDKEDPRPKVFRNN
tara:strand:+ start:349 stop:948 length:600 start_codon:yes stop_codon:yes gene_type:complete